MLKYLFKWFRDNRLTVNACKSSFTIFTTKFKRSYNHIPNTICVNNTKIHIASSTRCLGVILDEDLNWKDHINQLCNGLKSYFSTFYNIRKYLSISEIKTIYYTLIYSRIRYGLILYGAASPVALKPIQILQNQLLKVLTGKKYRYSTNQLHNELELIKVKDMCKQDILSFVFNHHLGKLPPIFDDYYSSFATIHELNTRNRNTNFHIPLYYSSFGSSSLKVTGCILWNDIDNEIKAVQSIKCFRKKLKDKCLPYVT